MSTSLEDLPIETPDNDYEESVYQEENEDEQDNQEEQDYLPDPSVVDMVLDKIKEPFVVVLLIMIFTNKSLLDVILKTPFINSYSPTIINLGLSAVAGLIFFIIKEFVFSSEKLKN